MEQAGSSLVVTVTNNSADEWKFPLSIPETPLHSQTTEGSDILEDDVSTLFLCECVPVCVSYLNVNEENFHFLYFIPKLVT